MGDERKKAIKVFYSYAHKDKKLKDELDKHLANLKQQGLISTFYDQDITAGKEWVQEIEQHLEDANIILLLISPDFIASDYHYGREMKLALNRQKEEKVRVLPIILRPGDYESAPFSTLHPLPLGGKPVTAWPNRDEAFLSIVQSIKKVIEEIKAENATVVNGEQEIHQVETRKASAFSGNEADFGKFGELDDSNPPPLSLQKNLLNLEAVSPSTERFSYSLDSTNEVPKHTKKGKRNQAY